MEALVNAKQEVISLLQESQFEHLSQPEQSRLRDYFRQVASTIEDAANPDRRRQYARSR